MQQLKDYKIKTETNKHLKRSANKIVDRYLEKPQVKLVSSLFRLLICDAEKIWEKKKKIWKNQWSGEIKKGLLSALCKSAQSQKDIMQLNLNFHFAWF